MVLSKYYVESTWNEWNVVDVKRKSSFTTKKTHLQRNSNEMAGINVIFFGFDVFDWSVRCLH